MCVYELKRWQEILPVISACIYRQRHLAGKLQLSSVQCSVMHKLLLTVKSYVVVNFKVIDNNNNGNFRIKICENILLSGKCYGLYTAYTLYLNKLLICLMLQANV